MEKYLRVIMSDGSIYDIPAEIIAKHRADHYEDSSAEKLPYHSSSVQPRIHKAEMEYAMARDEVLINWATKEMTWKDVEKFAVKVNLNNYEEEWESAEKEVIMK